jgi:hypothetical protein
MIEFSHTLRISPQRNTRIEHLNELDLNDFVREVQTLIYGNATKINLDRCCFTEQSFTNSQTKTVVVDVVIPSQNFAEIVRQIENLFFQYPFSIISTMSIVENKLPSPKGEDLMTHI